MVCISLLLEFTILIFCAVEAKNVYYIFTAEYICGAPDGVTVCHILSINKQFPGPLITATIGDTIHVTVTNNINRNFGLLRYQRPGTTVHWHGIFQNGTPFQDGPEGVTQCPIPVGNHQTYVFPVYQSGTYWWHSHSNYQYTEGMWGPLIVHNKHEVYARNYDNELIITLSDWYHTSGQTNIDWFLSPKSQGNEPIPFSLLINGRGAYPCNMTRLPCNPLLQRPQIFNVQPGKRYRIRVINTSAITKFFFSIPGHILIAIETDGVDTVQVPFDRIPIVAAQRYSFIVEMTSTLKEKWIIAEADLSMFNFDDPNINPNPMALIPTVRAKLEYFYVPLPLGGQNSNIPARIPNDPNFLREMLLRPYDRIQAPNKYGKQFILNVEQVIDSKGVNHPTFNNITYKVSRVPLLVQALEEKRLPEYSNPLQTGYNQVIQIVLNNHDTGAHPFHLHGHTFWVLGVGVTGAGDFNPLKDKLITTGVRRDTIRVETQSWTVIRFVTKNPGVWYFHCHINWHLDSGLAAVILEAPDEIRGKVGLPGTTRRICESDDIKLP